MKTFKINFSGCYESYPCKHTVTINDSGVITKLLMSGTEIIKLIMTKNIDCSYQDFQHFEYLFNSSAEHNFLNTLKNKVVEKKIIFNDDKQMMLDMMHESPEVTFSINQVRRCVEHLKVIHKCDKINSEFIYKNKNKMLCYISEIICFDSNGSQFCPNVVDIFIDNIFIKKWYSVCVDDFIIEHKLPVINNIKIIINDPNCADVFIKLYLEKDIGRSHCKLSRLSSTFELLYSGNKLLDSLKCNGVYSDIYFVFDNIELAKTISLHNILINVPTKILKLKDNTCCYKFCELVYGIELNNFEFKIDSEPQNVAIYGKRVTVIDFE
jgi:hypothetical protein